MTENNERVAQPMQGLAGYLRCEAEYKLMPGSAEHRQVLQWASEVDAAVPQAPAVPQGLSKSTMEWLSAEAHKLATPPALAVDSSSTTAGEAGRDGNLRDAAQAVLDRWNSPKWEWAKQGPTADLMQDLTRAIDAPTPQPLPAQTAPALYQKVLVLTTDCDDDPIWTIATYNGEKYGYLGNGGHRVKPVTAWHVLPPTAALTTSAKGVKP